MNLLAAAPGQIDSGDTAIVLVSAGLVLLMTPGLAFFYGGLVRAKNVVHTMVLSLVCMALIGVLWALVSYSLAFSPGPGGACAAWAETSTRTSRPQFRTRRSCSSRRCSR